MWTKNLPTEAGYYWWRKNQYKSEHIICVFTDHDESIEKENEAREKINPSEIPGVVLLSRYDSINKVSQENKVFYARYCGEHLSDKKKLESIHGEWQGPLNPDEN